MPSTQEFSTRLPPLSLYVVLLLRHIWNVESRHVGQFETLLPSSVDWQASPFYAPSCACRPTRKPLRKDFFVSNTFLELH